MSSGWIALLALGCSGSDKAAGTQDSSHLPSSAETGREGDTAPPADSDPGADSFTPSGDSASSSLSEGCGLSPTDPLGGVQLELDAGPEGDGVRSYWLSLPSGYNPEQGHAVVLGLPGTNALASRWCATRG